MKQVAHHGIVPACNAAPPSYRHWANGLPVVAAGAVAAGGLFADGCLLAHAAGGASRMDWGPDMSDSAHVAAGRGLGRTCLGLEAREPLVDPGPARCRKKEQQQQQTQQTGR